MSNALLLAEPEPATRGFLERHLRQDGFEVVEAFDRGALELLEVARPDLVLAADSLAADLRRLATDVPIIVIGRPNSDPIDRVRAFDGGCDDYVDRPFHYEELLARIRAVLRRVAPPDGDRMQVRDLVIDRAARRVTVGDMPVVLAAKEYELLVKLAADPTRVFTKEQLLKEVWGFRSLGRTRTLDSHASRLRRKLAAAGGDFVRNVWGGGLLAHRLKLAHISAEDSVPAAVVVRAALRVVPAAVLEVDSRALALRREANLHLRRSALGVHAPAEDEPLWRLPGDHVRPVGLSPVGGALVDPAADALVEDHGNAVVEDRVRLARPPVVHPLRERLERGLERGVHGDGFLNRGECFLRAHPVLLSSASAAAWKSARAPSQNRSKYARSATMPAGSIR